MSKFNDYHRAVEEIFESEGTTPPSFTQRVEFSQANEEDIIQDHINIREAIEIFEGRPKSDNFQRNYLELPWQKLRRLRDEITDLKYELDSINNENNLRDSSFWMSLTTESSDLMQAMDALQTHKAIKMIKESNYPISLKKLEDVVENLKQSASTKGKSEIYSHNTNILDQSGSNEITNDFEKRIFTLERVIGSKMHLVADSEDINQINKINKNLSILSITENLEQKMQSLDNSYLEAVKLKVSSLKVELENSQKLRISLGDTKVIDTFKKVDDLHVMLQKYDHFLDEIPELVTRMKSLEEVHFCNVEFYNKLNNMESSLQLLAEDVDNNNKVLQKLQSEFTGNISNIESNIKIVNEKLNLANR